MTVGEIRNGYNVWPEYRKGPLGALCVDGRIGPSIEMDPCEMECDVEGWVY
jgi:hypothetical protein